MEFRRTLMTVAVVFGSIAIAIGSAMAQKRHAPGVSDYEIKIGQTMPYKRPGLSVGHDRPHRACLH